MLVRPGVAGRLHGIAAESACTVFAPVATSRHAAAIKRPALDAAKRLIGVVETLRTLADA